MKPIVLVVEDEEKLRRVIEIQLMTSGYDVLKAATAETRMSGWLLAAMPAVAIVGVTFLNPAYAHFLFETETGHTMLIFAFGFQAMGCVAMARVMKLDF